MAQFCVDGVPLVFSIQKRCKNTTCFSVVQGGRTASDIVTHVENRLLASAKPHEVKELTGMCEGDNEHIDVLKS